ncbi:hypothetical protein D3C75_861280 [compost metagenome]
MLLLRLPGHILCGNRVEQLQLIRFGSLFSQLFQILGNFLQLIAGLLDRTLKLKVEFRLFLLQFGNLLLNIAVSITDYGNALFFFLQRGADSRFSLLQLCAGGFERLQTVKGRQGALAALQCGDLHQLCRQPLGNSFDHFPCFALNNSLERLQ